MSLVTPSAQVGDVGPAEAMSASDAAVLDRLRAAINTRADAPATQDLLASFGPRKIDPRGKPSLATSLWAYGSHGLAFEVMGPEGEEIIRSVQLQGLPMDPTFLGALPEGLRFGMTVRETFAVLGLPDEGHLRTYAWSPHHYGERGLSVQFDQDGRLRVVGLERRLAPGTIAFDGVRIEQAHADQGLTGFAVHFERTVGAMPGGGAAMTLGVELSDEDGAPVRGRSGRPDAPVGVEVQDVAASSLGRVVFIPYVAMDLAPGQRTLRGRIRATVAGPDGPRELPAAMPDTFEVAFDMPDIVSVRVGAREAVAAPGVYDGAHRGAARVTGLDQLPTHYDRPDLRFHVSYSASKEGQMFWGTYNSPSRSDAYEARWSELSTPFLVAPEDTFLLCIEDEDTVTPAEEVGCVTLTIGSAKAHAAKRTPLRDRKLERLILAPPVITPAPRGGRASAR